MCQNLGQDFFSYHAEDSTLAQAFFLLPDPCISRLSRAASARGTVADHNISLLCRPGVDSLCLRGRFTDQVGVTGQKIQSAGIKNLRGGQVRRQSPYPV